ncbi:MAG: creatininase family protein, partial [Clostridia bacterium]|nr:creatininase family protein [Clostridia bacterium]
MLEQTNRVCAINIGCVEKHGQHLPLGTDTLEGSKILELAAEREPVCVFPHLYFGDLQGAQRFKENEQHYGYIAFSAELLLKMLREICDEIGRNGFKRILLFSSHGGNGPFLNNFLRAIRAEKKDYEVFYRFLDLIQPKHILAEIEKHGRDHFPTLTDEDIAVMEAYVAEGKYDGHGGFCESALLLGTHPELARLDRCEVESGLSKHVTDPMAKVGLSWGSGWSADYPNSYCGHAPVGLTQQIADLCVEMSVQSLVETLKVLKDDSIMNPIIAAGNRE